MGWEAATQGAQRAGSMNESGRGPLCLSPPTLTLPPLKGRKGELRRTNFRQQPSQKLLAFLNLTEFDELVRLMRFGDATRATHHR